MEERRRKKVMKLFTFILPISVKLLWTFSYLTINRLNLTPSYKAVWWFLASTSRVPRGINVCGGLLRKSKNPLLPTTAASLSIVWNTEVSLCTCSSQPPLHSLLNSPLSSNWEFARRYQPNKPAPRKILQVITGNKLSNRNVDSKNLLLEFYSKIT